MYVGQWLKSMLACAEIFVSGEQKCITITSGKTSMFDLEDYGLSIKAGKDCLPPNVKECRIIVTADLTTNNCLPSGAFLVSAVYQITTTPIIERFNDPVQISMVHCANDLNQLCFVAAKEQASSEFEYVKGGTFEIDPKTGMKVGKINVNGSLLGPLSTNRKTLNIVVGCIMMTLNFTVEKSFLLLLRIFHLLKR